MLLLSLYFAIVLISITFALGMLESFGAFYNWLDYDIRYILSIIVLPLRSFY